jgi:hypothetical protein
LQLRIMGTVRRYMKELWNQDEGWSFTHCCRWTGRCRRWWRVRK